MDHNNSVDGGHISLLISIMTSMFIWINQNDISEVFKIVASVVSMGAGIMAIRYYYYSTKKNK